MAGATMTATTRNDITGQMDMAAIPKTGKNCHFVPKANLLKQLSVAVTFGPKGGNLENRLAQMELATCGHLHLQLRKIVTWKRKTAK